MFEPGKRKSIDLLVEEFWKLGYMTLSRKFGTYLPEPTRVGDFDVDIIARLKKSYAIGITLTDEDLNDPLLVGKLNFLATRHTKFTNKRVMLLIGIPKDNYKHLRALTDKLPHEVKKNLKIFQLQEKEIISSRHQRDRGKVLFS
ncbi:MAG: hypothetical protein K8H86_04970 [Ignavibacteriaceae bacterium]|nr:hypothetical protein [Ignavibacteriaceae bacterium]